MNLLSSHAINKLFWWPDRSHNWRFSSCWWIFLCQNWRSTWWCVCAIAVLRAIVIAFNFFGLCVDCDMQLIRIACRIIFIIFQRFRSTFILCIVAVFLIYFWYTCKTTRRHFSEVKMVWIKKKVDENSHPNVPIYQSLLKSCVRIHKVTQVKYC